LAIEHLALYPDTPLAAVERVKPLGLDHSCRRCPLSGQKGIRTVCVPPEGDPGGLLLVGEMPGRDEDLAGRPMIGTAGGYLRRLVSKLWAGPVAFDNGLRCHGVMASDKDRVKLLKYTDACRGFMAQTLLEVQPERVVALGSIAAYSLLGRAPPMMSVRRGYGWLMGDTPTPVYLLSNPAATSRNRFIKAAFEADLHWALTSPIPRPRHQHAFATVLSTVDEARRALASLDAARYVLFDVETAGLLWEPEFTLLCVAFASVEAPEHVYVFDGAAVEDPAMREELRAWVTTLPLAGQHVKFDVSAMACALGVDPLSVRIEFDTGLVRALLDSGSDTRLEVVTELVGMGGHKEEADELIQSGAEQARAQAKELLSGQGTLFGGPPPLDPPVARGIRDEWPTRSWAFATVPRVPLLRYNARDTMSEALLAELLEARLAGEPNLTRVWQTIVKDIIPTFACMEQWGIGASRSAAETLARWCDTKQRAVLARFQPYNIHPGSRDQVAELLFKRLGLPSQHATKTGKDSTDADALESMRGLHPVIEDMLVWRKYEKLRGTYADGGEAAVGKPFKLGKAGLVQWIRSDDRFHPSIKPHGTETGRPSCEKPNLMNIPRAEDEEGVMARNCFAAEAGWTLVEFDQSQIELRVMASQSGDKKMIDIFRSGVDFHYRTAQLVAPTVWRMKPEDVPKKGKERSAAKCFHPDTEVLTRVGWKRIVDLSDGEEVAQATPRKRGDVSLEWVKPLEVFTKKHPSGKLVHLKNEGMDLRVTPDHRMLAFKDDGTPFVCIPEKLPDYGSWENAGVGQGADFDGGVEENYLYRLAVAVQADGTISPTRRVRLGFTKLRKIQRMRVLLKGCEYTERVWSNGTHCFTLSPGLSEDVLDLLDEKKFPHWWVQLNVTRREVILEEAQHWDASALDRSYTYFSIEQQNADVLQAVAAVTGRKTRLVPMAGKGTTHRLTVRDKSGSTGSNGRGHLKCEVEDYDGEVACLSVPSTYVLVRDGGVPVVCGQTVNFAVAYGKHARSLACDIFKTQNPTDEQVAIAQALIDAILGEFSTLNAWLKGQITHARKHGFVWVPLFDQLGRRRYLHGVADQDDGRRGHAERAAMNSPVQGGAAELTLASLTDVVRWVKRHKLPVRVGLTVYDSIVMEVRNDFVATVLSEVPGMMTRWKIPNGVPLVADAKVGQSWGALEEVKT